MTLWQAVLLGAIQGLTEFLPVSSSAHLAFAHDFFGWTVPKELELSFDVALHGGTLIALLLYFRKQWIQFATDRSQRKLALLVLLACIPGGIAGLLLEKKAETIFREPVRIAMLLAATGVVLWMADQRGRKNRETHETNWKDSLLIGAFQAMAIMPGVSRSGITIAAGLVTGFTRESAARFSFLIALPITAGATLWKARQFDEIVQAGSGAQLLAGIISAAVFGYLAIDRLLRYLQTRDVTPFVVYRLALASAVIGYTLTR